MRTSAFIWFLMVPALLLTGCLQENDLVAIKQDQPNPSVEGDGVPQPPGPRPQPEKPKSEPERNPDSDPDSDPDSNPDSDPSPQPDPEPEPEPEPEIIPEVEPQPEPDSEKDEEPEPDKDEDQEPEKEPKAECGTHKERQVSQPVNKIDFAFVVDTSGSMKNNLAAIANGFTETVRTIVRSIPNVDYRIAVILGHAKTSHSGKLFKSRMSCDRGPLVFKGDASTHFDQAIKARLRCRLFNVPKAWGWESEGENGIASLNKAITYHLAHNRHQGFFRKDAALAIIFGADENDICHQTDPEEQQAVERNFVKRFKNYCAYHTPLRLYKNLLNLQQGRPLTLAGALKMSGVDKSWGYWGTKKDLGYKGILNLRDARPTVIDIDTVKNKHKIAAALRKVGTKVVEDVSLKTTFGLPTGSLPQSVHVGGKVVPYTFNRDTSEVQLQASHAGGAGDMIEIDYCVEK